MKEFKKELKKINDLEKLYAMKKELQLQGEKEKAREVEYRILKVRGILC